MAMRTLGAALVLGASVSAQCEITQLLHSTPVNNDNLGRSCAVAADTILAGAPIDDTPRLFTDNPGSVRVFERLVSGWTETQTLVGSDIVPGDRFGLEVEILRRAFISSSEHGGHGAVYVFECNGSSWSLEQKLLGQQAGAEFGHSVAFDGTRILVGAQYEDSTTIQAGAVRLFERVQGSWEEAAKIDGPAEDYTWFGRRVELSGPWALVGLVKNMAFEPRASQ